MWLCYVLKCQIGVSKVSGFFFKFLSEIKKWKSDMAGFKLTSKLYWNIERIWAGSSEEIELVSRNDLSKMIYLCGKNPLWPSLLKKGGLGIRKKFYKYSVILNFCMSHSTARARIICWLALSDYIFKLWAKILLKNVFARLFSAFDVFFFTWGSIWLLCPPGAELRPALPLDKTRQDKTFFF